ncbi:DUF2934 domain-containing protein [Geminicoccus flavidas]|uniref:DUF2934 domain-containing protein n=1 Tax=Geminicoccus flavidas TaxID=2506407 RepID=UPI00135CACDB|nr:DUF2934 domain-containing protein [Geminicoccus flavidas]
MPQDREALIRERAYQIWIERGRPEGQDEANWHEAIEQVEREQQAGAKMAQENAGQTIGRPKRGSIVADTRPAEEPENQTSEPPPVHAEKPAPKTRRAGSKTTGNVEKKPGKAAKAAAASEVDKPAAKPRKGKVKSASMETL